MDGRMPGSLIPVFPHSYPVVRVDRTGPDWTWAAAYWPLGGLLWLYLIIHPPRHPCDARYETSDAPK
jgi:hypothetical protein